MAIVCAKQSTCSLGHLSAAIHQDSIRAANEMGINAVSANSVEMREKLCIFGNCLSFNILGTLLNELFLSRFWYTCSIVVEVLTSNHHSIILNPQMNAYVAVHLQILQ